MRIRTAADHDLETIAGWLALPRIARWLDFGTERPPTALALKYDLARQHAAVHLRAGRYGRCRADRGRRPEQHPPAVPDCAALVRSGRAAFCRPGLDGQGRGRGRAARLSGAGDLRAINAWVVDGNAASVRILEKIGFRRIGRQRQCHRIEGRRRDRLLFDMVSTEFARPHGRSRILALAHDASLSFGGVEGAILASFPWDDASCNRSIT